MRILFHVIILVSKLMDDVLSWNDAVFRREKGRKLWDCLRPGLGPRAEQLVRRSWCTGSFGVLAGKVTAGLCGGLQHALRLETVVKAGIGEECLSRRITKASEWKTWKGLKRGMDRRQHFSSVSQRACGWRITSLATLQGAGWGAWCQQMRGTCSAIGSVDTGKLCDWVVIAQTGLEYPF